MSRKMKKSNSVDSFDRLPFFISNKNMPFSYVEAFKELRTNLSFTLKKGESKCVVITSSLSEESKSNVAMNLACALALDNKKVILVDADLRQPALHNYLSIKHNIHGLSDILAGNDVLDKCILSSKSMGYSILTAGSIPPNPSELIASESMQELINKLKEKYDYVLIDSAPVELVTDAVILSTYSDGVLFVVRSEYVNREVIKSAINKLKVVDANILGTILTRFDVSEGGRYGYGKYGKYGYGKYGKYGKYGAYGDIAQSSEDKKDV